MRTIKLFLIAIVLIAGIAGLFFLTSGRKGKSVGDLKNGRNCIGEIRTLLKEVEGLKWEKAQQEYHNLVQKINIETEQKCLTENDRQELMTNLNLIYLEILEQKIDDFFESGDCSREVLEKLNREAKRFLDMNEYAGRKRLLQEKRYIDDYYKAAAFISGNRRFSENYKVENLEQQYPWTKVTDIIKQAENWKEHTKITHCNSIRAGLEKIPVWMKGMSCRHLKEKVELFVKTGNYNATIEDCIYKELEKFEKEREVYGMFQTEVTAELDPLYRQLEDFKEEYERLQSEKE